MKTRTIPAMVAVILIGMLQVTTAGALDLRFEPEDQNIALNAEGSLSIWIDEALEVRTIEITVSYDGSILSGLVGGQGAAYQDLPCFVWEEYTPEENQWYGFAVSIGVDCFVVGPGELYTWNFTGIANGTSNITAVSVVLIDRYDVIIEEVVLPGTTVVVGDGIVSSPDFGNPQLPTILASPNPCNPMTFIKFWLPEPREASLDIYDMKGRRVRQLLDGSVPGEWSSVRWDGRTDNGAAAPSGVYLYRLETNKENLSGRVTLAR